MNPIDFLIKATSMSRAEITAKHGLGKNLLIKASQGRVQSITPRIESVLWKEWSRLGLDQDTFDQEFGTLSLDLAYQQWRQAQWKLREGKVPTKLEQDPSIPPFRRLVNAIGSLSKTAKLLMVADLPVQNYAEGTAKNMPEPILVALRALKYPYVAELDMAQRAWKRAN